MRIKRTLSDMARETLSLLPLVGLVPPSASLRQNGISLMMRIKNEEWIDLSLRSVKDFADEIVVVDTSTDDTPDIIRKVADEEQLNLKLIEYEERTKSVLSTGETYTEQSNIAMQNTSYRWLFKWDGDLIARTSGDLDIATLRERILNLNSKKYHVVFLAYANLDCDLFHTTDESFAPSSESHLFTYSPRISFMDRGRFEEIRLPLYYKPVVISDIYIFHLRRVKSAPQLLYRRFWTDWRETGDYAEFPNLQDYVKYRIRSDWGIEEMDRAARLNLQELCRRLVPYDEEKYGGYPELLKTEVENPRYKLICEHGSIVGRNDVGSFDSASK